MLKRIFRGEIYLCKFSKGSGSEQSGNRPVLVISNNIGNKNSPTFIGAVVTSKPKKKYPMHVDIPRNVAGLTEDSIVLTEQLFTIDKSRLLRYMGDLNQYPLIMNEVDSALQLSIGL
ncbi:MAG: type II toxin-antitoxin system PemK/MazF family toxin [Bacillota bacterium]